MSVNPKSINKSCILVMVSVNLKRQKYVLHDGDGVGKPQKT